MKKVGEIIKQERARSGRHQNFAALRAHVLNYPAVAQFLKQHTDAIDDAMVTRSLSKLYEFVSEREKIQAGAPPKFPNYHPRLRLNENYIDVEYVPTTAYLKRREQRARRERVSFVQLPEDLYAASFETFDTSETGRQQAQLAVMTFAKQYVEQRGRFIQAPYLYGEFGVGKTYLLGAMANYLAAHQISSVLIHWPTFVSTLKSAIADNTVQSRVERLVKSEVLVIDDIGAENNTAWTRDDILGVILQGRMSAGRPTAFSSNQDFDELEEHLTYSKDGQVKEPVKAARIMERVRYLATPVSMSGHNRRHD